VKKNITVSVPDDVYREARIRAAERGSSVSALVAQYLRSLGTDDGEQEFQRLVRQQEEVIASIERFSAADRLPRDELYDRALRRHERPALHDLD
jgi:plasmid stability protein